MNNTNSLTTSPSEYERDGVAVIRNALDGKTFDLLAQAIGYAESHPSPMAANLASGSGSTFFNDFNTWRKNKYIAEYLRSPELTEIVRRTANTSSLRLFHDHILVKRGDAPQTPWHQDRPYYLVRGPKNFSVWACPQHVPSSEGLSFLAGSHKDENLYLPVDFRTGDVIGFREDMKVLDDQVLLSLKSTHAEVNFELFPGDILIFDNRIIHKANRSLGEFDRCALSIRYLGDDCELTWVGVNQTPPFHNMGLKFVEGDVPPDAWFPPIH